MHALAFQKPQNAVVLFVFCFMIAENRPVFIGEFGIVAAGFIIKGAVIPHFAGHGATAAAHAFGHIKQYSGIFHCSTPSPAMSPRVGST